MQTCGILLTAATILVIASPPSGAQALAAPGRDPVAVHPSAASFIDRGESIREIDDPHSGRRWLLVRNASHPGGPGLLLPISAVGWAPREPDIKEANPATSAPLIRSGERITLEEDTSVVEARLEAVALNPARLGSSFNARLGIGGRTVKAVAVGPGRAVLEDQGGAWR